MILFLLEKTHHLFLVHLKIPLYPAMTSFNVTVNGVKSLLSNLDPVKIGGPDGLLTQFLKEMAMDLAPSLTLIFQASLHREDIPDDRKKHKLYQFIEW